MPMVVMEKCGVRAPKSVRLLTCMALVSKNPLLNHLLWNPSSILLKLFLTLVSIQEESKALTIKEKLKRKMQQQLKKTFKEDKKAEKERLKKMEEEEKMRGEELKEMSDKMRER